MQRGPAHLACALVLACAAQVAYAQDAGGEAAIDTGTDPTRLSRQFLATWEHTDLSGGLASQQLKLNLTLPFGERANNSVRFRVPVARVSGLNDDSYAVGDASVQLTRVFGVTREGGWVVQGELVFDTAERPELGSGRDVLKATLIRAKFLGNGAIFAPALVHSEDITGSRDRADVRSTTADFYYVPKLSDPRNLVTVDPFITVDWETDKEYGGLAVTFGRVVGSAFGGASIVQIKPTALFGNDRPGDWGVEIGWKLVGF